MAQSINDFIEDIKRGYIGAGNVVGLAKDIPDKKDLVQTLWIMAAANDGFASDNLASAAQAIEEKYKVDIFGIKPKVLPKWAQSVEASAIFAKLIESGYCSKDSELYRWNGTKDLFGFFADVIEDELKLKKQKGDKETIQWRVIASAFENISDEDIDKGTKQSRCNTKAEYKSPPVGWQDIQKIVTRK